VDRIADPQGGDGHAGGNSTRSTIATPVDRELIADCFVITFFYLGD
jgi:hypothetical protein